MPGRTRSISCLTEKAPIEDYGHPYLHYLVHNAAVISFELDDLLKDGLIEAVYVSPAIRPDLDKDLPQDIDERLIKLASINNIDTSPVDWSVCDEKLGLRFSVVPYYLVVIKDGIIPPKYITLKK